MAYIFPSPIPHERFAKKKLAREARCLARHTVTKDHDAAFTSGR